MVKKYHQTKKDRQDESVGMKRYERRHKDGMDDGYMGMISEDHSAPANLPQHVVHKYYPKDDMCDTHYLDDTLRGIDENIDDSVRKIESHQSDSMY